MEDLPAIRHELRTALGIGTGSCIDVDLPRGSSRGRVVAFTPAYLRKTGFSHGLVVTEPGYSRLGRQQTIVPVLPEGGFEPGTLDVVVHGRAWIGEIFTGEKSVILATALVATVFEGDAVAAYTNVVLDRAGIEAVDEALAQHFGLLWHRAT